MMYYVGMIGAYAVLAMPLVVWLFKIWRDR